MQVRSITREDQFVTWNLTPTKFRMKSEGACRSKIQYKIGQLIKKKYPFDSILEDVTIPDTRLSLDFFIPSRRIAFEIQGGQHNSRSAFFHPKLEDFHKQQDRDDTKMQFCILNSIELVIVNSVEEYEEWANP